MLQCTCFSIDPLDVYTCDSGCHEVSKYLNSQALGIVVLEKKNFEVYPFLHVFPLGWGQPLILYKCQCPCHKG